jgi:hypothetical protein
MKHTKATRNKSRRRRNKPTVEFEGKFVQVSGAIKRSFFRALSTKRRHGREALHHLFAVSKPMKKRIKNTLSFRYS